MSKIRPVFFISDGTGLTAEGLGQALLSQFNTVQFDKTTLSYIDSVDKAKKLSAYIFLKALDLKDSEILVWGVVGEICFYFKNGWIIKIWINLSVYTFYNHLANCIYAL